MSKVDPVNIMSNTIFELRDSVEVSTGRLGHVRLKQENYNQEVAIITVHPDDIPQLIEQLEKAGKEAQAIREELNNRPSTKEADKQ